MQKTTETTLRLELCCGLYGLGCRGLGPGSGKPELVLSNTPKSFINSCDASVS